MPSESQPGARPLPIIETTKTADQLYAELDSITQKEREIRESFAGKLEAVMREKEEVFAQIRYINARLKK